MNKQNLGWIVAMILLIFLIMIVGSIGYEIIHENSFIEGYNGGQLDIINSINSNGKIPIIIRQENQTSINWIPIQQICQGRS